MMLPHGAATIAELMLPLDREATTATTTMPTAALQCGAAAPARPPGAGVARLRGIMVAEAPTAPEAVPLRGAAVPEAPQDSEAALPPGVVAPVPTTGLSAVQAPGVVDNPGNYATVSFLTGPNWSISVMIFPRLSCFRTCVAA